MDILFNCPGFHVGELGTMELVDGKQRISAVLGFLANEFPILGEHFSSDFTDEMDIIRQRFRFHVNDLTSRRDVLQWYLDLNSGGTVHTETDLEKVRRLIEKEGKR
jgi:hypothetical protein